MRMRILFAALLVATGGMVPLAAQQSTKPPPGGYTPEQVIEVLNKLGYEPTVYGVNKDRCWINLNRGDYRTSVAFTVSSDRSVLWLDCAMETPPSLNQAPAKALRRLLEENDKIGPAHFIFDPSDKRLHLVHGPGNRDWTPARLKKEIEKFDDLVRKTEPIWRIDNFLRLEPAPEEVTRPEQAKLQGVWKLVEGSEKGKVTPPEVVAKANVLVTIRGNKLTAEAQKLEWTFFLDPSRQPKAVDFVGNKNRVEAGIYKLEDDRLIIHLAAIGKERPVNFTVPEGDKRSILVLKQQQP